MKTIILFLFLCLSIASAGDFLRPLPSKELLEKLTPDRFKSKDAVVILKEVSYNCEPSQVYYSGVPIDALTSVYTKVIIAKLFNEAAVTRYGTVEFTYDEPFGNQMKNSYEVRARVLKSDGDIHEMPESDVQLIIAAEDADGRPFTKKVISKIPDLAAGDVVQFEYTYTQIFTFGIARIFAYNERDPILFSNLYITLPAKTKVDFYSFPEEKIGKPQVQQISNTYGSGETYFWNVKNLNSIPNEPYSPPFEDLAYLTAFVVSERAANGHQSENGWNEIGEKFYKHYLDKSNVKESQMKMLGFSPNPQPITFGTVDSLYTAIRKTFTLSEYNSVYPASESIYKIFDKKRGDASDLAYVMYNILKQWKQNVNAIFIRDHREGTYEEKVPTRAWFNRIGILVAVNGTERIYDFDRSIAENYETPWFLKDITVGVISENGCLHKRINTYPQSKQGTVVEKHFLEFKADMTLRDSMEYDCTGASSQRKREEFYALNDDELKQNLRSFGLTHCMKSDAAMVYNQFMQNDELAMTFVGNSKATAENIESYITLKLKNHALKSFHDKIYSASRRNDIMLDEPFTMSLFWTIDLPKGTAVQSLGENKTFNGGGGSSGSVIRKVDGNRIIVKVEFSCPQMLFSYSQFPSFIKLMEDMTVEIEKDITLKKL